MSPEVKKATQKAWQERFRSVAKAQGRYLWLMLVVGIFYLAVDADISEEPQPSRRELPLIGVQVDSQVVWASGSPVLGFITLALLGTFPALAYAQSQADGDLPFESLDTEPTAIDFAVYSPSATSLWARIGLLAYPLFITLIVGESGWLWYRLVSSCPRSARDYLFLILGGALILACVWRLAKLWMSKIRKMVARGA